MLSPLLWGERQEREGEGIGVPCAHTLLCVQSQDQWAPPR